MQSISADRACTRPIHSASVRCPEPTAARPESGATEERDSEDVLRACRLAREMTSAFFAVPVGEIERPGRTIAAVCEARHVAMYLAHIVFQIPLSAMAEGFGRDRTTIAYAIRRIEDRRDDQAFDSAVERLERLAHAVRTALEVSGDGRLRGDA